MSNNRRSNLIKSPEYWLEILQNELYNYIIEYMEKNNLNQNQLAEKLGVTKGYISQILNGNIDFRFSTIIKLCLTVGKVPNIDFESIEDYIKKDHESLHGARNGFGFKEYTINSYCEDTSDEEFIKIIANNNCYSDNIDKPKTFAIAS